MAKGNTVYVGNIDFEVPEQKLIEELSSIGRVLSFKMVTDRTTGKSKGYGFCEYESSLIADAAVANLKITLNGRPIKINYADNDPGFAAPVLKSETELPIDDFVTVISQMDKTNLKEVLVYLKKMAVDNPRKLRSILEENRNLGIAIFQCLVELNLIEGSAIYELLKNNYDLEENKMAILERICQLDDEDLGVYDKETREKIDTLRKHLLKKENNKLL